MGVLWACRKKLIGLYLALILSSALLAYLASLNAEIHAISCPVAGLSNELVLAICSGVFAGGLVALLVEASRFLDGWQQAVDSMLVAAVGARKTLDAIIHVANGVTSDVSKMPRSFAEIAGRAVDERLASIFFSGYDSFLFDKGVGEAWRGFNQEVGQPGLFYRRCLRVQRAVLGQQLNVLRNGQMALVGCSACGNAGRAIDELLCEAKRVDLLLEKLIAVLDGACSAGVKDYVSCCAAESGCLT